MKGALMPTLFRLDSISPGLARAFRSASDDQRRRAADATCRVAVAQTGLQGIEVDAALALLRDEQNERSTAQHKLEVLATQLDEQYFKLSEKVETAETEALATFRKARAAGALAFALSQDAGQLHEAIYEAIAASSDPSEAMLAAAKALAH
jgi:hypothetical protein